MRQGNGTGRKLLSMARWPTSCTKNVKASTHCQESPSMPNFHGYSPEHEKVWFKQVRAAHDLAKAETSAADQACHIDSLVAECVSHLNRLS